MISEWSCDSEDWSNDSENSDISHFFTVLNKYVFVVSIIHYQKHYTW